MQRPLQHTLDFDCFFSYYRADDVLSALFLSAHSWIYQNST